MPKLPVEPAGLISKLTAAPQYSAWPPVPEALPRASASARRAPMTTAGHASGLLSASSGTSPGLVTLVSHAAASASAPTARREPPQRAILWRIAES